MIGVINLFNIDPAKKDIYDDYLRQVQPLLAKYNSRILFYGKTRIVCMGDYTQEYCGLVIYPNMQAVKNLSKDPEFLKIRKLRDQSTNDFEMAILDEVPV